MATSTSPVVVAARVPTWSTDTEMGVRRTGTAELPPAERAVTMLAQGLVEALAGLRPIEQLRIHCAPDVFAGLGDLPLVRGSGIPRIRSIHPTMPADGVIEACTVFQRGDRTRVLALRLEGLDGRWRLTALQLG